MSIPLHARPKLAAKAKLRFDAREKSYILLSPERGLILNDSALTIVKLCTGAIRVDQIAREIAAGVDAESPDAPPSIDEISRDVVEFLDTLYARALIELDP